MNKRINSICFLLIMQFYNCCYAQKEILDEKHYVVWSENIDFSWDYFLLKHEPKSTNEGAFIASGVSWSFQIDEEKNIIVCYTQAFMDKEKSWSLYHGKTDVDYSKSNGLLKHERGHFDITEIYAREARMLISKIKTNSFEKAKKRIDKITQQIKKKITKEQNQYDTETQYGKNKEKQAKWDKKIEERLKKLEIYKNVAVNIIIR